MGRRALVLEPTNTTHIEGTRLTLDQARRLSMVNRSKNVDPDDARRKLLTYRNVSSWFPSTWPVARRLPRA